MAIHIICGTSKSVQIIYMYLHGIHMQFDGPLMFKNGRWPDIGEKQYANLIP